MARERGLIVAEKSESQELCFVADDYRDFVREQRPDAFKPGPILDTQGREVGQHQGLPAYTIGQRKGLGLAPRPSNPLPSKAGLKQGLEGLTTLGEPLFVVGMDVARNALIVGRKDDVWQTTMRVANINWIVGTAPTTPFDASVKIRYKSSEAPAHIEPLENNHARVTFVEPQRAITPGQGAAFYAGEICLGGGLISKSNW